MTKVNKTDKPWVSRTSKCGCRDADPGIPVSAHFCAHTVLVTGCRIALNGSAGEGAADCVYPLYLDRV